MKSGWDMDGIAHSFGLLAESSNVDSTTVRDWSFEKNDVNGQWGAVCSNGILETAEGHFYDSLAFIGNSFDIGNFRLHQVSESRCFHMNHDIILAKRKSTR